MDTATSAALLLAIDTSTALTGLALRDRHGLIAECVWRSGRDHTAQLLPQLNLLLRQVGITPADLTALAVALGPGSWSGLRVGVSMAKGLALARALPIVGVSTLDVLAAQHQRPGLAVCALVKLGRERYGAICYEPDAPFAARSAAQNVTIAELRAAIDQPTLFCGELEPADQAAIVGAFGELASFPATAANLRRPGYLAELGWQRLQHGAADDLAALEPIYLGQPVAPRALAPQSDTIAS